MVKLCNGRKKYHFTLQFHPYGKRSQFISLIIDSFWLICNDLITNLKPERPY
uniref:Uncharacterized protein n=1 Tax=Triticum urartu TaxID=4572 RepID=A0A8R7JY57_TRIUA